jgi:uncharacterized protein (TIGR03435 family)
MKHRGRTILLAASGIAAVATVQAQTRGATQAVQLPQGFEVAVLRLEDPHTKVDYNRPDAPNQSNKFPTNRLTMYHTYMKSLIADAYGVPYQNILGGPDWLTTQHYDLSAKVEGNVRVTRKQMQPMLQNLLKERVQLAVHKERRIGSGYALVIANGGSKLKANTGAVFGGTDSGFELKFQNSSADFVAQLIESKVKEPVLNKTGLAGTYDFDLKFVPENAPTDSPNSQFGSIFNAVQEQLGLKLVGQKVPVDFLVIDHVEKVPREN